jgi:hypothetical protein
MPYQQCSTLNRLKKLYHFNFIPLFVPYKVMVHSTIHRFRSSCITYAIMLQAKSPLLLANYKRMFLPYNLTTSYTVYQNCNLF